MEMKHPSVVPKVIEQEFFKSFELEFNLNDRHKDAYADVNCLQLCFIDDMKYMQCHKGI